MVYHGPLTALAASKCYALQHGVPPTPQMVRRTTKAAGSQKKSSTSQAPSDACQENVNQPPAAPVVVENEPQSVEQINQVEATQNLPETHFPFTWDPVEMGEEVTIEGTTPQSMLLGVGEPQLLEEEKLRVHMLGKITRDREFLRGYTERLERIQTKQLQQAKTLPLPLTFTKYADVLFREQLQIPIIKGVIPGTQSLKIGRFQSEHCFDKPSLQQSISKDVLRLRQNYTAGLVSEPQKKRRGSSRVQAKIISCSRSGVPLKQEQSDVKKTEGNFSDEIPRLRQLEEEQLLRKTEHEQFPSKDFVVRNREPFRLRKLYDALLTKEILPRKDSIKPPPPQRGHPSQTGLLLGNLRRWLQQSEKPDSEDSGCSYQDPSESSEDPGPPLSNVEFQGHLKKVTELLRKPETEWAVLSQKLPQKKLDKKFYIVAPDSEDSAFHESMDEESVSSKDGVPMVRIYLDGLPLKNELVAQWSQRHTAALEAFHKTWDKKTSSTEDTYASDSDNEEYYSDEYYYYYSGEEEEEQEEELEERGKDAENTPSMTELAARIVRYGAVQPLLFRYRENFYFSFQATPQIRTLNKRGWLRMKRSAVKTLPYRRVSPFFAVSQEAFEDVVAEILAKALCEDEQHVVVFGKKAAFFLWELPEPLKNLRLLQAETLRPPSKLVTDATYQSQIQDQK